jgi:hypothetical protein
MKTIQGNMGRSSGSFRSSTPIRYAIRCEHSNSATREFNLGHWGLKQASTQLGRPYLIAICVFVGVGSGPVGHGAI